MEESLQARRQRLIDRRRCIECERKLSGDDRGALCSSCYFGIITDPGLADPVPQFAGDRAASTESSELQWRTGQPAPSNAGTTRSPSATARRTSIASS